ncbi:WD40-repeat-containing domain protein [Blastocladiella britannica]|nr:WD40-repeat-containing domain protein [Blastocladiella britannica]
MANIGTEASDFFQSDASLRTQRLRDLKRSNTLGDPVTLSSKILHMVPFASPLIAADQQQMPLLLVGDAGQTARIVDATSGKTVAAFRGHTGPVTSAVYYYDAAAEDTIIFTGSWDKTIKKWSYKSRECLATYALHSDFVKSLVLSPNRRYLISGSSDKSIRVIDLATPAPSSRVLLGHVRGIESLAVTGDSAHLWSAGSEGSVRKWDLATGTQLLALDEQSGTPGAHATSVYSIFLEDDETMWTASADKFAKRWTVAHNAPPRCESTFEHDDYVKCVVPVGGALVVTGGRDEVLSIWDMASEKLLKKVDGHFDEISVVCVYGNTLYSGSLDGTIRSWKVSDLVNPSVQFRLEIDLEEENVQQQATSALTAEEEAELAELMGDD